MSVVAEAEPVSTPDEPADELPAPVADAEKTTDEIFQWSQHVHVGDGAEECPHGLDGACTVEGHFHAWVRLPNPFQLRDILDKANAAKARKLRELRDPDSDASVTLDGELEGITELGEEGKALIADELVAAEFTAINQRAVREVDALVDADADLADDEDADEPPKKWALIDQDIEELGRQELLAEGDRDEGFDALEKRVTDYRQAVAARMDALEEERRQELMQRTLEDLIRLVRRDRAQMLGTETYLHTYQTWEWYVCTFKPKAKGTPNERVWRDIGQMKYQTDSTIIVTLRHVFDGLESRLRSRRAGKGS